jgi:hypothetical protein
MTIGKRQKRIEEILNFLRNQGYTSLDLIDELELLIATNSKTNE